MERPLLAEMERRSSVDWGEAPNYTEEYRRIRWHRNPIQTITVNGVITLGDPGFPKGGTPTWKLSLRENVGKKRAGTWNGRTHLYSKSDTRTWLKVDMLTCMRENIPFRTKTFEYRPSTQTIYVNNIGVLFYDLRKGHITHFTYGGVYNKITSLLFRMFFIGAKLKNKKLVIEPDGGFLAVDIELVDLNKIYELPRSILVNPELQREDRTTDNVIL